MKKEKIWKNNFLRQKNKCWKCFKQFYIRGLFITFNNTSNRILNVLLILAWQHYLLFMWTHLIGCTNEDALIIVYTYTYIAASPKWMYKSQFLNYRDYARRPFTCTVAALGMLYSSASSPKLPFPSYVITFLGPASRNIYRVYIVQ